MPSLSAPINRRQTLFALASLCATTTPLMNAHATTIPAMTSAMTSASAPLEVSAALQSVQLLGQAPLRFFGLLVYEARLWTTPKFDAARYESSPFALELEYARKLEGAAIAERSIAEMRRVDKFSEAQAQTWLKLMTQAFPSVGAQDRITGVNDGAGGVRFYFNGKETGAIQDKIYARLFFGIWLSPKTSSPALRSALIHQA